MSGGWSARQTAEDLIAQVEDALGGGWQPAEVETSLVHQGLEALTAKALVADVAALPGPEGGTNDAPQVVELVQLRRFLRQPDDPLALAPERVEALAAALREVGLPEPTAQSVVGELAAMERRMSEVYSRRMRRLGLQGMAVGVAATALLAYGGLYGGPEARWHLITATMTAALALYSLRLWRRGRGPGVTPKGSPQA